MATQATSASVLQQYYQNVLSRDVVLDGKQFSVTSAGTQQITWNLPHAGVPRAVYLAVDAQIARTDGSTVGTVTASEKYPWILLQNVTLTDYLGVTRIDANGYDLHKLGLVKAFGYSPDHPPIVNEDYASVRFSDNIPAGAASSTTTDQVNFVIEVPVSYSQNSIRGSYVAQVSDGTAQLVVTVNAASGSTLDQPVTVGGGTTVEFSGTITPTYLYYDAPVGVKIPKSEVSVIHEVIASQSSDNLAAGEAKKYVMPTGRTYYRILEEFVNNGALDTLDIQQVQFLINDSTPVYTYPLQTYLHRIVQRFGRDMPTGMIVWDFAEKPWRPQDYGSLAVIFLVDSGATVAAPDYARVVRDALTVGQIAQQAAGMVG